MIIAEGSDATGKTTFANLLAERLDCYVIHSSKPKMNMGWLEYLDRAKRSGSEIYDRFHIGEAVWPIIFDDGRKPMLRWQQEMIERVLLQRNALLVFMFDSFDVINNRLKERGENEISLDVHNQTYNLFNNACGHTLLNSILLFQPLDNTLQTIDKIMYFYAKAVSDPLNLNRFRGCGTRKQGVVMVIGYKDPQDLNIIDIEYAPLCRLTDVSIHIAMQLSGKKEFYLTYFRKTGLLRYDKQGLIDEYLALQPSRIVCVDNTVYDYCISLLPKANITLATRRPNTHDYAEFFK